MNRIAIICSGYNQLPLVKAAIDMGYYVIAISAKSVDYHISNNIKYYSIDLKNYEELYRICLNEKICSICSIGMEQAVIPIAYINGKFNFPGITKKNAHICTDKSLMKKAFQLSDVSYPQYSLCNIAEPEIDTIQKCCNIGFPVVFKPKNLCSSIGIVKIQNEEEVAQGLTYIKGFIKESDDFIIEEYIYGESFGVEVLVSDGKIRMLLPLGNLSLSHNGIDKPIGHYYPYSFLAENPLKCLTNQIENIVKAIGIKDSFLTIDCRLKNDNNFFFLEVGARCGGVLIPELLSYYYNCDVYKLIILQSLGYSFNDFLPSDKYLGLVAGFISTPNINKKKINLIIDNPEIIQHYIFRDNINNSTNQSNYGYFIINGETPNKAIERFNEINDWLMR